MKVVGLTGGIGSGKSTVAELLKERGARLIDADFLARQVVEPGRPAWNDIIEEFGSDIKAADDSIDRDKLGSVVFNNEDKRRRLNEITHPRIGEEMVRLLQKHREEGAPVSVIDAALLLESPATKWIKPVIVVTAPDEEKARRVALRDGLSGDDVMARIKSQWSDDERAALADFVIDNSGDLDYLREQVDEVWRKIAES
ncbi:MAG: dephospho-CoA kinase [bacterium]